MRIWSCARFSLLLFLPSTALCPLANILETVLLPMAVGFVSLPGCLNLSRRTRCWQAFRTQSDVTNLVADDIRVAPLQNEIAPNCFLNPK